MGRIYDFPCADLFAMRFVLLLYHSDYCVFPVRGFFIGKRVQRVSDVTV